MSQVQVAMSPNPKGQGANSIDKTALSFPLEGLGCPRRDVWSQHFQDVPVEALTLGIKSRGRGAISSLDLQGCTWPQPCLVPW